MARRPSKSSSPSAAATDREMSDLGAVRKVRFGLALKFTLPVTLALTAIIVIMGLVLFGIASDRQQSQFNEQGVAAAHIAAAPEVDSWERDYNTLADLYARLGTIEASLAIASGSPSLSQDPSTEEERAIVAKRVAYDTEQRSYNQKRLREVLGSSGFLDLLIIAGNNRLVSTASGRSSAIVIPETGAQRTYSLSSSKETVILEGVYKNDQQAEIPARYFKHPIKNRKGSVVGFAYVVMSETALRDAKSELKTSVITFCILAILIAAAVAFVSSKMITRPLGHLLRDIRAVAAGDLEHRTKARSTDEIGVIAGAFDHMTRNLSRAELIRADLLEKDHQINIATEVQERLFPRDLPTAQGLSLSANHRLAGDLSVDLFDAVTLPSGRIGCLVMTASGRGVPAAIVLSMARSIFRSQGFRHESPAESLRALNRVLAPDLRRGMYVSAFYAILDPNTGDGLLASAGHRIPALHYIAAKGAARKVLSDGMAMGLDKGPIFDKDLTETAFHLDPGDRLLLSTEGAVTLLGKENGGPLGEDGFFRAALRAFKANGLADEVLAEVEASLAEDPGDHDLTVVVAARN